MSTRYAPIAHGQLRELVARKDPNGIRIEESVQYVLDLLEENPGDARVRANRFIRPPVWAAHVSTPADEDPWVVLWSMTDSGPYVVYIGPSVF